MILENKKVIIMGVRNKWSIAWGAVKSASEQGAKVICTTSETNFEKVKQLLEESGLIFLEAYEEYTTQAPQPDSGRIVVVAQEHGKNRRN